MEHKDFHIGLEFWTATGAWRCTDVGNRTVVAIKLGPRETVTVRSDGQGQSQRTVEFTDDPRDLNGPPYSVAEHVFDEDDIEACYRSEEEMHADVGY